MVDRPRPEPQRRATMAESPSVDQQSDDQQRKVELLAPLVGRWSGTARIAWPGREPFELTHTEQVHLIGDHSMITIEGNSYRDGVTAPVFSAFAVAYDSPDGLMWQAFRAGQSIAMALELTPGAYRWSTPSPQGTVDYHAEFDDRDWTERGTMIVDGERREVFAMRLTHTA